MIDEVWLPVKNYEGLYEVSSFGRVRGLDRVYYRNGYPVRVKGCIRKQQDKVLETHSGNQTYKILTIYKNNISKTFSVHILVADAFLPIEDPNKKQIRHLDGNGSNNVLSNLKRATQSENEADKLIHKTQYEANKTHCPRGHKLEKPNLKTNNIKNHRNCLTCKRVLDFAKTYPNCDFELLLKISYENVLSGKRMSKKQYFAITGLERIYG